MCLSACAWVVASLCLFLWLFLSVSVSVIGRREMRSSQYVPSILTVPLFLHKICKIRGRDKNSIFAYICEMDDLIIVWCNTHNDFTAGRIRFLAILTRVLIIT